MPKIVDIALPSVGDVVTERVSLDHFDEPKLKGIVVYVNRPHHYYTVAFDINGTVIRQSYILPKSLPDYKLFGGLRPTKKGNMALKKQHYLVKDISTGELMDRQTCAERFGISLTTLTRAINNGGCLNGHILIKIYTNEDVEQ